MNFNIQIDQGSGYVDITKWCLVEPRSTEPVPFNNRNRDVTPIYSSFKFILSDKSGITPAKDDLVLVDVDSEYVFMGYIINIEPDDWMALTEVEAIHYLDKLNFETLEFYNLPPDVTSTADPFEYTSYFNPGVASKFAVLYFVKRTAEMIGATIDTSDVENIVIFSYNFPEGGGDLTPGIQNVYHKDAYFDLDVLLSLNQPDAAYHGVYDDEDKDYNGNKISYRKLLSEICSSMNYTIHPTGSKSFILKYNLGNNTITANSVFEGNETARIFEAEDLNANVKIASNATTKFNYTGGTPVITPLEYQDNGGKSGSEIDWFPTFRIFFYGYVDGVKSATITTPETYEIPTYRVTNDFIERIGLNPATFTFEQFKTAFPLVGLTHRKIAAKIYVVNQWEYKTNYSNTQKGVLRNFIDLQDQTSEIIQEEYET